jgi:hypothetical protein
MVQLIPQSLLRPLQPGQPRHCIEKVLSGASLDDAYARLANGSSSGCFPGRRTGCIRATPINIGRLYPLRMT